MPLHLYGVEQEGKAGPERQHEKQNRQKSIIDWSFHHDASRQRRSGLPGSQQAEKNAAVEQTEAEHRGRGCAAFPRIGREGEESQSQVARGASKNNFVGRIFNPSCWRTDYKSV